MRLRRQEPSLGSDYRVHRLMRENLVRKLMPYQAWTLMFLGGRLRELFTFVFVAPRKNKQTTKTVFTSLHNISVLCIQYHIKAAMKAQLLLVPRGDVDITSELFSSPPSSHRSTTCTRRCQSQSIAQAFPPIQ